MSDTQPGIYDPPNKTCKEYAAKCTNPLCRDVFERAAYAAATEIGAYWTVQAIAFRLVITEALASLLVKQLIRRGVIATDSRKRQTA